MVRRCCITGCSSASHNHKGQKNNNGLSFHRFPTWRQNEGSQVSELTKRRRMAWVSAVRRTNITTDKIPISMRVCSLHFHSGKPAYEMCDSHPDWVPSLHLGHGETKPTDTASYDRQQKRKQQRTESTPEMEEIAVNDTTTEVPMAREDDRDEVYEPADKRPVTEWKKSENPRSADFVPSIFNYVPTQGKKRKGMPLDEFDRGQKSKLQRCEQVCTSAVLVSPPPYCSLESSTQPPAVCDTVAPAEESTHQELKEGFQPVPTDSNEPLAPLCSNETCTKYMKYLELKYQTLKSENLLLKEKINSSGLNETGLQNYDKKINILTGLPTYSLLMTVFNFVAPFLQQSNHLGLTIFQQFMLTLIKLRMNLSFDFLAYYFGVDSATASEVFKNCISIMYCRLAPCLVIWPDRESLRKSLPCAFRNSSFEMTVCIIDCFEICIEKPSDLLASAQSFSTYNTVKYLIAICPQGSICFISNGWGGRTSDKFITQQSHFLSHLLPGDLVLSDRDLDNQEDTLHSPEAEIRIPVYTLGNNQLDPVVVDNTECLESLRTHIEKVFGILQQKYPILQSSVPIGLTDVDQENDVTYLDKVVKVCCALTNVSESLVHLPSTNYGESV